jgi:hypothetical protein
MTSNSSANLSVGRCSKHQTLSEIPLPPSRSDDCKALMEVLKTDIRMRELRMSFYCVDDDSPKVADMASLWNQASFKV